MKHNDTIYKLLYLFLILAGTAWLTNTYAQNQNSWEELSPLSNSRCATRACVISNDIFIFGGWTGPPFNFLAAAEKYNTQTGETTVLENMSVGLAFPSVDTMNHKIFVAGGFINMDDTYNQLQQYDPGTDSWMLKKKLPSYIGHHVSCVINEKLYISGGLHRPALDLFLASGSFVYDPDKDEWDSIASMNSTLDQNIRTSGRWQASSCVLDGKLYVFGGFRISGPTAQNLSTPEVYDPETDSWTDLAEMPVPIAHHTSVEYKGKMYLFGGTTESNYNNGAMKPSDRVFEYNPEVDSWQEMEPMPFKWSFGEGCKIDNFLYLLGGDDDETIGGEEVGRVWRFNLDSLKVRSAVSTDQLIQELNLVLFLEPNHPNPFSEYTNISYELSEAGPVELVVYDMLGRNTDTIVDEIQVPGKYCYHWIAEGIRAGLYFCQLKMGEYRQTIKMVAR